MKQLIFLATLLGASVAGASPPDARQGQVIQGALTPAPGVTATGKLDAADVASLRSMGIRHVVDLSLDEETPDLDEAAAVQAQGVGYSNLPLRGAADLTLDNVRAFDRLLRESPRPLLVHCASGNRVGAMAALRAAWLENRPVEEAIAIGRAWGLTGLEDAVRMRIEAGHDRLHTPETAPRASDDLDAADQTAANLELEYETLFTNRLILQSTVEAELHGKDDARRAIGSGLSTVEAGLRLRYEFNRQFAPYIGVVHERAYGNTADFRRAEGEDIDDTRIVTGLRLWF